MPLSGFPDITLSHAHHDHIDTVVLVYIWPDCPVGVLPVCHSLTHSLKQQQSRENALRAVVRETFETHHTLSEDVCQGV
jgi:L-ascorbate metabolism protein UlaG (beta-lactamase superfamily)